MLDILDIINDGVDLKSLSIFIIDVSFYLIPHVNLIIARYGIIFWGNSIDTDIIFKRPTRYILVIFGIKTQKFANPTS